MTPPLLDQLAHRRVGPERLQHGVRLYSRLHGRVRQKARDDLVQTGHSLLQRGGSGYVPLHRRVVHGSAKLGILLDPLAHGRVFQQSRYQQCQRSHGLGLDLRVKHGRLARSGMRGMSHGALLAVPGMRRRRLLCVSGVSGGRRRLHMARMRGCRRRGCVPGMRSSGSRLVLRMSRGLMLSRSVTGMWIRRLLRVTCVRGSARLHWRVTGMRIIAPRRCGVAHMPIMCASRVYALCVRSVRIRLRIVTGMRICGRCIPVVRGLLRCLRPARLCLVFPVVAAVRAACSRQHCEGNH
jgi:hypothetical protein